MGRKRKNPGFSAYDPRDDLGRRHGPFIGPPPPPARRYRGNSTYSGKFRRPTRRPRITKYDRRGIMISDQVYGANTMKDCNYLGMATMVPYQILQAVGIAFLRYIMKKHYYREYSSAHDLVQPDHVPNATEPQGIMIYFENVYISPSGVETRTTTSVTYTVNGTDKVRDFGIWFATQAQTELGGGTYNNQFLRIKTYTLLGEDEDLAGPNSVDCYMDTMKVSIFCTTKFKIQNTTMNDSGTAALDVNNANPIRGRLFKFKGLNPKFKDTLDVAEESWNSLHWPDGYTNASRDGVLFPASDPPLQFQQVPNPSIFSNCRASANVMMQPGQIKSYTLKFKYFGTINDLIKGLAWRRADGVFAPDLKDPFGMCYMFAFEQLVKTGSAPIVLNYQVDRTYGAYVIPPKPVLMKRYIPNSAQEANNDPAPPG